MHPQDLLTQSLVYLAAGVIAAPIAKRLGLGSVLGYLIAGLAIGPFALNLVGQQEDVMRFAEFGVVILLFLIGLEVRPASLWRMRGTIFGFGGAQVVVTGAVLAAGGLALGLGWRPALAGGLILAMSSTAIVLQMLDEKGLTSGPVGRSAFGVLLFQDLAVIPLFAILPLLGDGGGGAAEAAHGGGLLAHAPVWMQALATLAAVATVIVGGRYLTRPLFRFIAGSNLHEIFTAAALLLVVAVAALMELVGLSPALGAFLAGVVLAESEFRRELEADIEPFRGLFLGLFFITVGAGLNIGVVLADPLLIVGVVAGLMLLKGAVIFALGKLTGAPGRDAATVAVALAQGGEFCFVLLGFAVGSRALPEALAQQLTAAVAVSMALTPLAMLGWERALGRFGQVAPRPTPGDPQFDNRPPDAIVAGYGRFGQISHRLLAANGFVTVTLDSSIEQLEAVRRFGRKVHYGDASRIDLLRAAGAEKAKLLVVAIDDRDKALELVEKAREAFPDLVVLSRAFDRLHAYELLRRGAHEVERETFEGALAMGERALRRLGFKGEQARKAADAFRRHDLRTFVQMKQIYLNADEEAYASAAREVNAGNERVLAADMARIAAEAVEEKTTAA